MPQERKQELRKKDMDDAQEAAAKVVKKITSLAVKVRQLKSTADTAGATEAQTAAYMTADGELQGLQASSTQLLADAQKAEQTSKAATKALEEVEMKQSGAVYQSMKKDALQVKDDANIATVTSNDEAEWAKLNGRIADLEKKNGLAVQMAGKRPSKMSSTGAANGVSATLFSKLEGKVDNLVKQQSELQSTAKEAKQGADHAVAVVKSKFGEDQLKSALRAAIKASVEAGSNAEMQKMVVADANNGIGAAEAKQLALTTKAQQDTDRKVAAAQERVLAAKSRAENELTQATTVMQTQKEKNDAKVEDELSLKIKDIKKLGLGVFDESKREEAVRKDAKAEKATFAKEVEGRLNAVKSAGDASIKKLEATVVTLAADGQKKIASSKSDGAQLVSDAKIELASAKAQLATAETSAVASEAKVKEIRAKRSPPAPAVPAASAPAAPTP